MAAQPEQAYEAVDAAWQKLQLAVEAHGAVGAVNDPQWVHVGLLVVRRRAQGFLQAVEALLQTIEE